MSISPVISQNTYPAAAYNERSIGTSSGAAAARDDIRSQDPAVRNTGGASPYGEAASNNGTAAGQENRDTSNGSIRPEQTAPDGTQLTDQELRLVEQLKTIDQEVRQHEMAHLAAGAGLVTSGAQFSYKTGPDGQRYAVAGEVGIDTSAVPGDPRATMEKMQQIKRAALAPASPSAQDLRVAAKATATAAEAAGELTMLMAQQQSSRDETKALGSARQAADTYSKVNTLPEGETHTFQLAV